MLVCHYQLSDCRQCYSEPEFSIVFSITEEPEIHLYHPRAVPENTAEKKENQKRIHLKGGTLELWGNYKTSQPVNHIPRHWVVWLIPFKSQYWLFSAISRNTPQPQRATLKSAWILQELLRFPKPKQMGLSPCQPLGYHAGSSWLPIFLLRNLTEKKAKTKTQYESKSALLSLDLSVKDQ